MTALFDTSNNPNAAIGERDMTAAPDLLTQRRKRPVLLPEEQVRRTVLIVDDDDRIRDLVSVALYSAGYETTVAAGSREALECIAAATPDLIISDIMMPEMDGLTLLTHLRADPITRKIPLIFLTAMAATKDVVTGLGLGADDYLPKPFEVSELIARVRAKLERPPVPSDLLPHDRQTDLLSERPFMDEVGREVQRVVRGGPPGYLAYLYFDELPRVRGRFGARAEAEIAKQVAALVHADDSPLDVIGRDAEGRFLLLLPETPRVTAQRRLSLLSRRIDAQLFTANGEHIRLTPTIGFAPFMAAVTVDQLHQHALRALEDAHTHLDLQPVGYNRTMDAWAAQEQARASATRGRQWRARLARRLRLPVQILLTLLATLGAPFVLYVLLAAVKLDITPIMYPLVVVMLLITAYFIWVEGFFALPTIHPSETPGAPYPAASAIIAAYLPNEAATIEETVEALLRVEYPGPLQVILAYNTPRDLPVEEHLREIARRDPRFLPLRVEGSVSKAQNVNTAIAEVTGEFVGVFDADHHPQEDSFTRAWRWLSNGYDVVQGHCLIRNGDDSWVSRLIAVEFEGIYAVSHPGRARLHDFGIFGGTNGYWKTNVLRQMRMHRAMLTEDIDSSLRAVEAGYKIASDPYLISRELAPVNLTALWNQRLRWAQGWFQVSLKYVGRALRSPHLSPRQKVGMLYLLAWREVYPLLSMQIFPILAFWIWRYGLTHINWLVPIFLLTSLVTLSTGPGQVMFTYLRAAPEIRRHRRWFIFYLIVSSVFYTPFKTLIAMVAQVKELMHEKQWKVTPRTVARRRSAP